MVVYKRRGKTFTTHEREIDAWFVAIERIMYDDTISVLFCGREGIIGDMDVNHEVHCRYELGIESMQQILERVVGE